MLKPFSVTFVVYEEGDFIGKVMALFTLVPVFIMVSYATLIVFNRNLKVIYLAIGQLLNELLNYKLKLMIREPRPNANLLDDGTFGMPSSHSQFICFWACFVLVDLLKRGVAQNFKFLGNLLYLIVLALPCIVVTSRHDFC
jgi:dolichyldiphosphatase